jgi:hypothetical protein
MGSPRIPGAIFDGTFLARSTYNVRLGFRLSFSVLVRERQSRSDRAGYTAG